MGVGVVATAVVGVGVGASALAAKDDSNGADNGIHGTTKTQSLPCNNATTGQREGTFTYTGPDQLWPPNHKYRYGTITLTDEDDEALTDNVTLMVTASHDQVVDGEELKGSGHTPFATDATAESPATGNPSAGSDSSMRGERSGKEKGGRTYTFNTAGSTVDSGFSTCAPVSFTAKVPHDQRKK